MPRISPFVILALILATRAFGADPGERERALAAAAEIDRLVAEGYGEHGVTPNDPTGDAQFARRAYLDIAGRIPTYDELTAFLASGDSDKRYGLIDQLLEGEGHVSHSFNYWADVLRVKTRLVPQVSGAPYINWVKSALRDNMPYDQFVYELLTAEGRVTDNGAAGYLIRDTGMPLDNMANTVRVFLGTRIGCAQCHDHPFDKWTQYEFYEMAAFTSGVDTRERPNNAAEIRRAVREAGLTAREQQALNRMLNSQSFMVRDTTRKLRLPADYKYDDAKPRDVVAARTIFGEGADDAGAERPREAFAAWLTGRDNPRFAQVIANRLWKRAMGLGLVEPVDDFTDDTEPSNPRLMAFLTEQTKGLYFDLRAVSRSIYYSQTYQRQASTGEPPVGQPYHFPGPVLRRMTSEQLWDSLMTLVVPDIDGREGIPQLGGRMAMMEVDVEEMSPQEVIAKAREYVSVRGGAAGERRRMIQEIERQQPEKYRGVPVEFVRASEWTSPAQPGSFLEQFGASDRELVDGSNGDPTVTQALEMLNGRVSNGVLNARAVLARAVAAENDPKRQIDVVFLSVLGREPDPRDQKIAREELKRDPRNGLRNVAAALLNTREFMFVQ